ncbi:xanthan lyase [Dysgonomonas sp. Marseille-P4677]|uniref:golvesin C-terminal-like domain-containing protein n=1 Tax=Dysgonomonas sp. Marseille-P4677 TaxID=2364790 RepID=UPI00191144D2|nr:xanthan lyase [Dysgonomonas sp. Marseille-P4677]MBK5721578.1 xanthan lyase [Dysgonomonas sp. Marseille-P4677]
MKRKVCYFLFIISHISVIVSAQTTEQRDTLSVNLTEICRRYVSSGVVSIDSILFDKKRKEASIYTNVSLSYIPFTEQTVSEIENCASDILPDAQKRYKINIITDGQNIRNLVPNFYRESYKKDNSKVFANKTSNIPLKSNISTPYPAFPNGLTNRHIALWQSHGWYYEQKLARWEWQRARLMQTVEDLYTQSYVLPYLVPMLENAGANVLLPRERDIQRHEIIVDNDGNADKSIYKETDSWTVGSSVGFAKKKESYLDGENPFRSGSWKYTKTTNRGKESLCEWIPDIPEKGKYGVYISYQTVENSTEDALYTVHHLGGKTEFRVNQTMGGSTWIFLGYFSFDKGVNNQCKVTLSNRSNKNGRIVTADAVKIGGGMGNIARLPHPDGLVTENTKSSDSIQVGTVKTLPKIDYQPKISGYPRYTEGARYWLQWAGAPDSIYNRSESKNDYTDDFQSRGYWVNYISGGSSVLPQKGGLNIPIDLAFAFHTDAGISDNDSIIGTLGICMTHFNDEKFENGKSRWASRDMTEIIMNEIIKDIRSDYEPEWSRRHIWNRSYSEARVPEVPTMLLELLSHQNLADMRYGLDPRFQFTVSRSIYKGMLKFLSSQYGYDYIVQPLPVKSFSADFLSETQVELKWLPVEDKAEPTSKAEKYILYTRIDDNDFDNGILINDNHTKITIEKDKIYSFKIAAVNNGGESFPSEILSVCRKSDEQGCVLVVNGFNRLSAPHSFASTDSIAGFVDFIDHGVPDKIQYNYVGSQYEFRRQIPWIDDDAPGFGASNGNFESSIIAGNTFDYPYLHGKSIVNAGYSFISASSDAICNDQVDLTKYKLTDLILGKQKQTKIGRGIKAAEFKTFPKELQDKITSYCKQGGNIFVSGAYVASDLWDSDNPQESDQKFASDILKYKWRVGQAAVTGQVKSVASPFAITNGKYAFYTQLNPDSYAVESPDAIEPAQENSYTIVRYSENNLSAGIAYKGDYKTCVLGFPFETIMNENSRNELMKNLLNFMFE